MNNIKPKSRKEILDTCQKNFWHYSTLSKIMIFTSLLLSASAVAYYICGFVIPIIQGIINNEITGWQILLELCFCCILYIILKIVNLICISIGGTAIFREENWDTNLFAKAWLDIYKYEKYLIDVIDDENENNENFEK